MKNLLFFFTFFFFALDAITLEKFYHIDNKILINAHGKRYPALDFASPLHEELAYRLKDPQQAATIHQAYQKHIAPHIPEEFISGFSKALLKMSYFFGSQKLSIEKGFWKALQEEGCLAWAKKQPEVLARFIYDANRPADLPRKERKKGPFRIALLTTSASGGNESVAFAIAEYLSVYETVQVHVLDVETLAKEADVIMMATGAFTFDGLYAEMFQQKEDANILSQRVLVAKEIGKYIPSCLSRHLKEKVLQINPDLIISTRSYSPDDLALATLDIPFAMLHCDYELNFYLLDFYGKVTSNGLKFWLPSLEPAVFKSLFIKADRLDLYDENESVQSVMEKVAFLLGIPTDEAHKQFTCVGYPTRPEFKRIDSSHELEHLRRKWDILPDETPILVSMGKYGVGSLERIYEEIAKLAPQHLKFIFICGKNEEVKNRLQNRLSSSANRCTFYGYLAPKEMNELMNLCAVHMTKPGGAITAEAQVTKTYLLMIAAQRGERANGAKIEKMGLGQTFAPDISLQAQIEESLAKAKIAREKHTFEVPDWKKLLWNELNCEKQQTLFQDFHHDSALHEREEVLDLS